MGKGELLLGMVLELIRQASHVRLISFACFMGDGQVLFFFFFFLSHSVRFKPCDLHGCRHHLLSVLAYNSWLDLGLFFSCDAGSVR